MKSKILFLLLGLGTQIAFAENATMQSPITMQQLMQELRIQGGNWTFTFERPVYAKVVITVSTFPDAKVEITNEFISDKPASIINLFFMASASNVGEYPKPNQQNSKKMKIKLSNCIATDGTRIVQYFDKFSQYPWNQNGEGLGEFAPSIPAIPELNKEYILHYYFKEGDAYEAKATICFIEKPEDSVKVLKFSRKGIRDFKEAGE